MYLSADQACGSPNSLNPGSPFLSPEQVQSIALLNLAVAGSDQQYGQVINPDWQSFASLGPQVAFQVLNAPIGAGNPVSAVTQQTPTSTQSATPAGVQVSSPMNPLGSNPSSGSPQPGNGGSPPGSWRVVRGRTGKKLSDPQQFAAIFGPNPNGWQTYTGPLPPNGTPGSLVYGGNVLNRTAQIGTNPPAMPQASAGYAADCTGGFAVSATPSGEPAYPWPGNGGGAATGNNGVGVALAVLLGLAAASYFFEEQEKRKRRAAA